MSLSYAEHERLDLKAHREFNEVWIHDRIADSPGLLGLGELELLARERRQEKAGRLDLLLQDADGECRYEVEVMLGATDPSHIIRTIEYWDIERRRYPGYEHVAVIVAEDITSRFLNVLGLFSGSIPLVAIQMSALRVGCIPSAELGYKRALS
jgi:RecB family endonuclease NucS